jgi:beta-lactamase regulating signal transducer with metallopeptidase domain
VSLEISGTFGGIALASWVVLLAELVVKGVLLFGGAYLAARFLGRGPALLRSRIWTSAYLLLLMVPFAIGLPTLLTGAGTALPLANSTFLRVVPEVSTVTELPPAAAEAAVREGLAQVIPASPLILLPAIWLLGVGFFGLRLVRSLRRGRRAAFEAPLLRSVAVENLVEGICRDLGISSRIELRSQPGGDVPFIWSARRSIVVLPAEVGSWDGVILHPLLCHELAHVKRRDLWRLILIDLVSALFWFHPLARPAARRARLEIEMACDEVACRQSGQTRSYARQLLWFAQRQESRPHTAPAMTRVHAVEERLRNVLRPELPVSPAWPRRVAALLLPGIAFALLLPFVSTRLEASDEETGRSLFSRELAEELHVAATGGDTARVLELIGRESALVDAPDEDGMTPLALAAWEGHVGPVKALVRAGADLDRRNRNGLTPLFCAMDRSRWTMARCLMENGADLFTHGFRGRSLLHEAARHDAVGFARALLEAGVAVNGTDTDGCTPLDHAVWSGRSSMSRLLRTKGAVSGTAERPGWARSKRGELLRAKSG